MPANILAIEEGAFSLSGDTQPRGQGMIRMMFPASLQYLGADSFKGRKALREIMFDGEIPYMAREAFVDCAEGQRWGLTVRTHKGIEHWA